MIRGKLSASTLVVLCALINKFYFDKAVTLPLLYPGTDTLPPPSTPVFLSYKQFTTISSTRLHMHVSMGNRP